MYFIKEIFSVGAIQNLSKDSRPNFRNLYRQKGKKLSDDQKQSKKEVKERLNSDFSLLSNKSDLSPVIREKILKLHVSIPDSQDQDQEKSYSYKSNKQKIYSIILSFGLNFQRVQGTAITSIHEFYENFVITNNLIEDFTEEDCESSLKYLHEQGLIYQFSPVILFEPLEQSQDINIIFSLIKPSDHSLQISIIQSHLTNWSVQKINHVLEILVDNGLAIIDGNTIWFPQLE